jgi:hypothetical protein
MTEPIKLPPLTVKMLMDVFGSHADIPPALLCTLWKDGIDIDETSMRAQMLVEAYARLAIEQNTAELRAEVERLRAELSATTERLENRAGAVQALCAETVRLEAERDEALKKTEDMVKNWSLIHSALEAAGIYLRSRDDDWLQEIIIQCAKERDTEGDEAVNIHELKTWPEYFKAVVSGSKTFEFRRDDRGFFPGDKLYLREWNPETARYTGRFVCKRVSYILRDFPGIESGHVVMALQDDEQEPTK